MSKCGQILENKASSICGKDICCFDCESKCEKACKSDKNTCEYVRDENTVPETKNALQNTDAFVAKHNDFLNELRTFKVQFEKMKEQEEIMKDKLKKAMAEFNIKSFENDNIKITLSEPTTRSSIDKKRLEAELPDIAKKYTKVSEVSGKLTIEPKNKETRL